VLLARKTQRNRRRGPVKDTTRAADATAPDRYDKYLPVWMKGSNGAPAPRPARPRRARPARPAGGYTPGKFAVGRGDL
jgi:hypothetical protein